MNQTDFLHRYIFEKRHVRGELVQLNDSFKQVITNHDYPEAVQKLIGDLMSATCLLTATLKFEGEITVQMQGNGPVRYVSVNSNHKQQMRGVARVDGDITGTSISDLIGKGQMVITIMPEIGERYQGIVALDGDTVAECLENYFRQSEQLSTRLWLETDTNADAPKTAGMLIQVLPVAEQNKEEDFQHLEALTNTITADEMLNLDAQTLLTRLYHEDNPELFEPQSGMFKCGCSREKCESAILNLGSDEINHHINTIGPVDIKCDACNTNYHFSIAELQGYLNQH